MCAEGLGCPEGTSHGTRPVPLEGGEQEGLVPDQPGFWSAHGLSLWTKGLASRSCGLTSQCLDTSGHTASPAQPLWPGGSGQSHGTKPIWPYWGN